MTQGETPRMGVIMVNWRGWRDTLECLESLLKSVCTVKIVVVDNSSGDGSIEQIQAWARGAVQASAASRALEKLSKPEAPKPINLRFLTEAEAELAKPDGASVTLIMASSNLGFAGGNNLGLRYLAKDPAVEFFWLLNNDTVADPQATLFLQQRLEQTPNVGMCGTVVRYYHRPDTIQALNGSRFSLVTGFSRGIETGSNADRCFDPLDIVHQTDFVLGASLAVSRAFLETIGPMCEDYFLYFEEVDWAFRNSERFAIAFAEGAVVYHKEGGSIGSSADQKQRSDLSDYYLLRSRLLFIRRFAPALLPVHWVLALAQISRRIMRRQPRKGVVLLRALLGRPWNPAQLPRI